MTDELQLMWLNEDQMIGNEGPEFSEAPSGSQGYCRSSHFHVASLFSPDVRVHLF